MLAKIDETAIKLGREEERILTVETLLLTPFDDEEDPLTVGVCVGLGSVATARIRRERLR